MREAMMERILRKRETVRKMLLALGVCASLCSGGCTMGVGDTGEKIYRFSCVACHSTGAAGAPKVGDRGNWRQRADQGLEMLVSNAINGKRGMPAKGGNPTLTDDEIKRAVEYMLAQMGVSAN